MEITWNKAAIATNTKKQFIDSHQHFKDHADLEKVWEDAQPKKAVKETAKDKTE